MIGTDLLRILTRQERRSLALLAVLVVVTAALEAAAVTVIYPFLLVATNPSSVPTGGAMGKLYAWTGATSVRSFLLILGAGILALVVLSNVVGAYTAWRQQRFVRAFEHDLSVRMLRHFLHQPYPFFLRENTAELQRRLLRDPRDVSDGALDPALEVLQRGVAAVAIFGVLLVLQPTIALAAATVFGLVYFGLYRLSRGRLRASGEHVVAASQSSAKASAEALSSIKMLKLTRREEHFVRQFAEAESVVSRERGRHSMYQKLPRYVIEGLTFIFLMVTFLAVLASGRDLVSVLPLVGMFAFAGFRLMPAVHALVSSASRLKFGEPIVARVASEFATPPARVDAPREPIPFNDSLRVERVGFCYEGSGRTALSDVDITIPKGTRVGIVGRTGSGKTTLLDVVLGLLRPTTGRVLVDGRPLDGVDLARWQQTVAYVPQQVVLLDDTITRNIAFGVLDECVDHERVRAAAKAANVLDFIEHELPDRFDTVVGERGVRLSGGQRQRLGIARALYEDKDVIVFDEATSEVDSQTELAINDAIQGISRSKTILVVAHRFSAVKGCDQMVLLDAGTVLAKGTYADLILSVPQFRTLAEASVGGAA